MSMTAADAGAFAHSLRSPIVVRLAGLAIVSALLIWLAPLALPDYWVRLTTSALILSIAAASVSLIFAQLGMVSLGQQAVMGVGAWAALRIGHGLPVPFEVSLMGAGITGAVFGVLMALPSLRTRGVYFALSTLMIESAFQVAIGVVGFPDGGPGFLGRVSFGNRIVMARPWLGQTDLSYLRYCAVAAIVCLVLVAGHARTRPGRAWAQIRSGEAAAIVGGVNIPAFQLWAFALSGFLAGVSGGLLAGHLGNLDPTVFPAGQSILLFAAAIVGGAFNWFGPLVSGFLMRMVPGLLTDWNIDGNVATVLFGVALLHALVTAPRGIAAQLAGLAEQIARLLPAWRARLR